MKTIDKKERVKKVIFWILSQGIAKDQKQIAEMIGYNQSAFSQIVTGKKAVSKKFIKNLCRLSEKINQFYLFGESDCMILEVGTLLYPLSEQFINEDNNNQQNNVGNNVVGSGNKAVGNITLNEYQKEFDFFKKETARLSRLLEGKDEQINRLLSIIEKLSK